jgi:SAM-dependent methyltransferase
VAEGDDASPWYTDDAFWEGVEPVLFGAHQMGRAAAQVDALLTLVSVPDGGAVLDLCCGVGRHAIELARRGFVVTGVDRTRAYLERARERARLERVGVEFVQEDMREFVRPAAFDAAISLTTSFGYFESDEDDRRVVAHVFDSLRPGGTFVVDMIGKEVLARIFREQDWHTEDVGGREMLVLEERRVLDNWSRIACRWVLVRDGVREDYRFSHRLYSAAELTRLLVEAGFASVRAFGDLTGVPYDPDARRLVVTAVK